MRRDEKDGDDLRQRLHSKKSVDLDQVPRLEAASLAPIS